jgi:hypothetical protein
MGHKLFFLDENQNSCCVVANMTSTRIVAKCPNVVANN